MRLICPNCDAQYEVDDAAVPAAGRDVQCSSCGHAWFQLPPDIEAERAAESALYDAPEQLDDAPEQFGVAPEQLQDTPEQFGVAAAEAAAVSETEVPPAPAPDLAAQDDADEPALAPEPLAEPAAQIDDADAVEAALDREHAAALEAALYIDDVATFEAVPGVDDPDTGDAALDHDDAAALEAALADDPPLQSREVDEAVLAVLRDEAAREMIARRLDAEAAIETQAELGVEEAVPFAASAAARHIALMKGEDPDAGPEPEPLTDPDPEPELKRERTRREMLPDIEEINSSLRPGDVAISENGDAMEIVRREESRGGFRSGFVLMLVLAAAAVAVYVMAPRIAEKIPGAKPTLDGYVTGVDRARVWLDDTTRSVITSLRGFADDETPAP